MKNSILIKFNFSNILISKANRSNRGFTIIEVLIALAIFSIGLMAMSALQSSSLMATGDIAKSTEAWAVLEDHVDRLKEMPFYANDNNNDDNGNGVTDEWTETMPDLVDTGVTQTRAMLNNRYTVHWRVVDDLPIGQVTMPPANAAAPLLAGSSGAAVPNGTYTVSKTISVWVTLPGGNPLNTNEILASCQFVKTWSGSGQRPYK